MARDFEICSVSFAAGALLSTLIKADYILLGAVLLVQGTLLLCLALEPSGLSGKGRGQGVRTFTMIAVFACLGAGSLWSEVLGWTQSFERKPRLFVWLDSSIDALPFRNNDNRQLLKALLCGDKSGLDNNIKASFRTGGASHVLALSGLHLGIICTCLEKVLSLLGGSLLSRVVSAALCICFSIIYADATLWSPSMTRAVLFVIFRQLGGLLSGRDSSLGRCWFFALMVQLCLHPLEIVSPGFWLSYSSMLGIVAVLPWLKAIYPKKNLLGRLWGAMSTAFSCQLFTAPLSYALFDSVPLYFLLTNIIAVPLTEVIITGGLVCLAGRLTGADMKIPCFLVELAESALRKSMEIISEM